mmetsp:Transcript_8514/g.13612  ORF Transcript_8514/g.13612 Transcript_8514/m.13612 type:complete len:120 (-) Transcript_8514:98-457(-)
MLNMRLLIVYVLSHVALASERDTDRYLDSHRFGNDCRVFAESLETEVGLFDDKKLTKDQRRELAHRVTKKIRDISGKSVGGLEEKLFTRLDVVSGPFAGDEALGAGDVCEFALKYHDEL